MIAIIGSEDPQLIRLFSENKIPFSTFSITQVPSLTMLIQSENIDSLILVSHAADAWSAPHILTAAALLKGSLIFWKSASTLPGIPCCDESRALLELLRQKESPPANVPSEAATRPAPSDTDNWHSTRLDIPPGGMFFLGVAGSQSRIGCTTQAIGLWHYCKSLGFDPAIVMEPSNLKAMAVYMEASDITGGQMIEGIPFVTSSDLSYDCYIFDLGTERTPPKDLDILVCVAGSKPWEIPHTITCLQSHKEASLFMLSFATAQDLRDLQTSLFKGKRVIAAPYVPALFHASTHAMMVYERTLQKKIINCINSSEKQEDNNAF